LKYFLHIIFFLTLVYFYSCSDPIIGTVENLPPDTYLTLFPDSIIAPGSTQKKISWWGDDPDGFVTGYRISFDSLNWSFTTKQDSIFILSISGNDSTFRFWVAAVDDMGAVDPTPASNLYPVVNTLPVMQFDQGTEIPDSTLPVASFKWTGSDPDGSETIRYYHWALNDTNNFRRISGQVNLMTLFLDSGLQVNSNNVLYMKAEDNAGAFSPVVRMPDTSRTWHVKPKTSSILMLRDIPSGNIQTASDFYNSALDTIHYDMLDIKSNNGALIPKIINPMFIETLKLYQFVIWTGGTGSVSNAANFDLAQSTLPFYIQAGGKIFFTSGFQGIGTGGQGSFINFAPVDSITLCTIPFVTATDNDLVNANSSYPVIGPGTIFQTIKGLHISNPANVVYRFFKNSGCFDTINVAIKNPVQDPNIVYMAMPVYFLNKYPENSKTLFRKILIEEFGY
jgi:hypothetical protein